MSYVYGHYQDFIPLYVYYALKTNPDISIKIFLKEELTDYNRKMLDRFATDNVQVVENYFIPCPIDKLGGIRALIPEEEFSEFDYIYLTDIDMVEIQDMTERCHYDLMRCEILGLPFNSGFYKTHFKVGVLSRIYMGCMFIKVKPYYEKMSNIIDNIFDDDHKEYIDKIKSLGSDELLLYYMLDQVFKLDLSLFEDHVPHGANLHVITYGGLSWEPSSSFEKSLIDDICKNGFEETRKIFHWNSVLKLKM